MLPAQPISSIPVDTMKIIYTLIIAGCLVVFLKFFKPRLLPPPAPVRRPIPRSPPVARDSDVFGDIDNNQALNVPRPGRPPVEKESIYDGFKNSPNGLDLGKP
jgi:hypothetical protein